jgi:hypothetical protein
MGEAKRRAGVSAADFIGPDGMLTLTIDCEGAQPASVSFDTSIVVDTMAEVSRFVAEAKLPYYSLVRGCHARFVSARNRDDDTTDEEILSLAVSILWSCFNHPRQGDALRGHVSRELRLKNKAHLTWRCGHDGLAVGLGEGFLDLEHAAAQAKAVGAERVFYRVAPGQKDHLH